MGGAVLEAINGCAGNWPGGREVGLANRQADDVAHLVEHVEEAADARRRNGSYPLGQEGFGGAPRDAHDRQFRPMERTLSALPPRSSPPPLCGMGGDFLRVGAGTWHTVRRRR